MMAAMTERGLPTVNEALACPFVAFDDVRDSRATSPDHRHRCYAEVRPAPRALAHQQAYCLSSAFAVCPTFQDWARREAAQARSVPEPAAGALPDETMPISGSDSETLWHEPGSKRNPPRDWASPPPWTGTSMPSPGDADDDGDDEPEVLVIPHRGGGLSGSFADRLAAGASPTPPSPTAGPAGSTPTDRESEAAPEPRRVAPSAQRIAPSWERPPRREAYPTLKTRMGLSGVTLPPLFLGVVAVIIAVPALFFLPAILGVGNPDATPAASPSAGSSGDAASAGPIEPTAVPEPTPQIYLVEAGDTMSRIANRFGVPLQLLIDANRATIPNPDKLTIGQEVRIPTTAPTLVPDAGGSPVPAASTSP